MVSRPSALRHRPALRLRTRLRADAHVHYRRLEHPRCDPVRAHARQRRILITAIRLPSKEMAYVLAPGPGCRMISAECLTVILISLEALSLCSFSGQTLSSR